MLTQAVEALEMEKDERIKIRGGTHAISSITYQTLFKYYPKLSGMTVSIHMYRIPGCMPSVDCWRCLRAAGCC